MEVGRSRRAVLAGALIAATAPSGVALAQEVYGSPIGEYNGPIGGPMVYGQDVGSAPIGGPMMYGDPVGSAPIGGPMVGGAPVGSGGDDQPIGGDTLY